MPQAAPVLQILSARPFAEASVLPNVPLDLTLAPGECALIETPDPARPAALADLCSGMVGLRAGEVRFMGYDWSALDRERAAALRGRIGRIHLRGGWIDMLGTHVNIMLPRLHHTRQPEPVVARAATDLARQLGLPGLPLTRPDRLSEGDLMRAGCVRAFLGEPQLLLLESAISADHVELTTPLLELLSCALDRGAAAICFTHDLPLWQAQSFPLAHRLHLMDDGLKPVLRA